MKLLKFFSPTCGPCKIMATRLKDLKNCTIEEHDISTDNGSDVAEKYKVRSIPTLVLLNNNDEVIETFNGIVEIETIQTRIDNE